MVATPLFSQARHKLRRAGSHVKSIEATIERYFCSPWYSCEFGRNPESQYNLKVVTREMPEDPGRSVRGWPHSKRNPLSRMDTGGVRAVNRAIRLIGAVLPMHTVAAQLVAGGDVSRDVPRC